MRNLIFLILTVSLFGCGTSRKKWTTQHCNPDGGYQMGQSDAKHKRRSGILALKQKCSSDEVNAAITSYEKGFKAAGDKKTEGKHQYGQDILRDAINIMDSEKRPRTKKKNSKPDKVE